MTSLEVVDVDEIVGWLELPLLDQWRNLAPGSCVLFFLGPDVSRLQAVVAPGEHLLEASFSPQRRHLWIYTALWASPGALPRLVFKVDGVPLGVLWSVRGFRANLRAGQLWTLPPEWDKDDGV